MKNKKGVIYKRKNEILQELYKSKKVLVDDLAKMLHVSPITIRRDLDEFQAEGIVERFYGGAALVEGALSADPSERSDGGSGTAVQGENRKRSRRTGTGGRYSVFKQQLHRPSDTQIPERPAGYRDHKQWEGDADGH